MQLCPVSQKVKKKFLSCFTKKEDSLSLNANKSFFTKTLKAIVSWLKKSTDSLSLNSTVSCFAKKKYYKISSLNWIETLFIPFRNIFECITFIFTVQWQCTLFWVFFQHFISHKQCEIIYDVINNIINPYFLLSEIFHSWPKKRFINHSCASHICEL